MNAIAGFFSKAFCFQTPKEDLEESDLTNFRKYTKLPSELHHHVLSYNNADTLANYAPCSKTCNSEIQRFNTRPPCHIVFHQYYSVWTVQLSYKRRNESTFTNVLHFSKPDDRILFVKTPGVTIKVFGKDPREAAIEYVKNRFKYVKTGECGHLDFDGNVYLPELLTIPGVRHFHWDIELADWTFPEFYESVKNVKNDRLHLKLSSFLSEDLKIPIEFFRTDFFQNLAEFDCEIPLSAFRVSDFLSMKAKFIYMDGSAISEKAINQKIRKWADDPVNQPVVYCFFRKNARFDKSVILDLHIQREIDETRTIIQHQDGSDANFNYNPFIVSFASTKPKPM